jgi:phospholipid/cholesterol/gamma-HCH transport system permease protein
MAKTSSSSSIVPAEAKLSQSGDELILNITGDWSLHASEHLQAQAIFSELEKHSGAKSLIFQADRLGSWDTSLLIFVNRIEEWCREHNLKIEQGTLPAGITGLLALADEVPERKTGRGDAKRESFITAIGKTVLGGISEFKETVEFVGETVLSFGRIFRGKAAFDWRLFWLTIEECSAQALPIAGLISFLVGLILGFVGSVQLKQFGAGIYVANLVAVAMAREMGAIMTGIIMAGRTGAAFAAQIGTMKVSEEVDALRTLAISPSDFLVAPRLIALCLMMPLLVLYADAVGILGGAVVGVGTLGISWVQYWNQTLGAMNLADIITGLLKSAVFGVIVAVAGCQKGIQCGNNAAAVGNAATSAVVLAITWIVASDAIIDVLQQILKF